MYFFKPHSFTKIDLIENSFNSIAVDGPMDGSPRVILIVGVARFEWWKRAPMKRFAGVTVPEGHGGARRDG